MNVLLSLLAAVALAGGTALDDQLRDAASRIEHHDYEGARILLDEVFENEGSDHEEAGYLYAVSLELAHDLDEAQARYEGLLTRWPTGLRARDIQFRLAELQATRGNYRAARAQLDALGRPRHFAGDDRHKVALWSALWRFQDSGRNRHGRRLARTLSATPEGAVTFYQAKARASLASFYVDQAGQIGIDHPRPKRAARAFQQRLDTLDQAYAQLHLVIALEEPEWILATILETGVGYAALAEALASAPEPDLTPEQLAMYREAVRSQVSGLLVRVLTDYQHALDMAHRIAWKSRRVAELERAHHAIESRIEALDRS